MIIYCAGPLRGDVTYQNYYVEIVNFLESVNHTALAEIGGKFNSSIPLTDKQIFRRDIKWIEGSRIMIAEISGASLGVGFEIAYALFQRNIPVLALANADVPKLSAMIAGCESDLLTIQRYRDSDEMKSIILEFIREIEK
jgi:2'-deoxynucleoside 5'-phosphate N-hydrolase